LIESFKRQSSSKTKVQWLDLAFCLWPLLVELSFTNNIRVHYEVMVKYFKLQSKFLLKRLLSVPPVSGYDNGDVRNQLAPLSMHVLTFFFPFYTQLLIINFVQCCMFSYSTMVLYSFLFIIMKGKKQCFPLNFKF
jgi:hypothetical protein